MHVWESREPDRSGNKAVKPRGNIGNADGIAAPSSRGILDRPGKHRYFGASRFSLIERQGNKLHYYRAKVYRISWERAERSPCIRFCKKHVSRFPFRSNRSIVVDDQLGETVSFWQLIEQGEWTRQG